MRVETHMSSSFLTTQVFNSAASSSVTSIAAGCAGALQRGDSALFDDITGVGVCEVLNDGFGKEVFGVCTRC